MGGCVWVGESFLRNDKSQIKLLSEFFTNSHSTFYKWLKLKKKSIVGFQKFTDGYEGMFMSGRKFLKESKVTDKIIEWIFFQFTFNLLQMIQTQEIINCRVSKFTNLYEGMCMSGTKFIKKWQVTDKIIEWIVFQFTFNLLWMTQTQKIITCRILKIHKWIWGDVYE